MNNQKTNSVRGSATAKGLLFVLVLLISACDGGIFGTGGPDDILATTADTSDAAAPNVNTDGTVAEATNDTETGGSASNASASADAGASDGGASDNGASDNGASDGGSADAGTSDAGVADGGTSDGGASDGGAGSGDVSLLTMENQFNNSLPTLDSPTAKINLINTSSVSLNVIETGAPLSSTLFGADGVAPDTQSNAVALQLSGTSIDIIDNETPTETVVRFPTFIVESATFTTLLVRQNGVQIDAIPLISETKTTDSSLIKVRVVQAGTLGDPSVSATFNLQSVGANSGGVVDRDFGPMSFNSSESNYTEINQGDYQLTDPANRINNQMLTLEGGNVYTVIVLGDSSNAVLLINDTETAAQ